MSLILNNIVIEVRESDNFINATQLCKAGGKLFKDWVKLDSTKELIKSLEAVLKKESQNIEQNCDSQTYLNGRILPFKNIQLIDVQAGKYGGSWTHPDLAVPLAQWISPSFAIQVSRLMRELMIKGTVSLNSQKTNKELNELQYQLENSQKQLAIAESKMLVLNNEIMNEKKFSENGYVYIATTRIYALHNQFRFGRTKKLDSRLETYKSGRPKGDELYYAWHFECSEPELLELIIRRLLVNYRDDPDRDWYIITWEILKPWLDNICEMYKTMVSSTNELVDNVLIHEKMPIIPEPLKIKKEYLSIKSKELDSDKEQEEQEIDEVEEVEISELEEKLLKKMSKQEYFASMYDFLEIIEQEYKLDRSFRSGFLKKIKLRNLIEAKTNNNKGCDYTLIKTYVDDSKLPSKVPFFSLKGMKNFLDRSSFQKEKEKINLINNLENLHKSLIVV